MSHLDYARTSTFDIFILEHRATSKIIWFGLKLRNAGKSLHLRWITKSTVATLILQITEDIHVLDSVLTIIVYGQSTEEFEEWKTRWSGSYEKIFDFHC